MKTTLFFFALLLAACSSPEKRVTSALSDLHKKPAHIVSLSPCMSNAADSIKSESAYHLWRLNQGFAMRYLDAGAMPDTIWIGDSLKASRVAYDSALARLKSSPCAPGFSLVRYTVNREPDTLTAVLDPSFRVVWSR